MALSSSWYCAGATSPGGAAPGDLLVDNAGLGPVKATVRLVWSSGATEETDILVASGTAQLLPEDLPRSPLFFPPNGWAPS